jgi:hypothetical protein
MYDYDFYNDAHLEYYVDDYYEREASFFDGYHSDVNNLKWILLFRLREKRKHVPINYNDYR